MVFLPVYLCDSFPTKRLSVSWFKSFFILRTVAEPGLYVLVVGVHQACEQTGILSAIEEAGEAPTTTFVAEMLLH